MKKNVKATTNFHKTSFFKSIKGKIVFMGTLSIIALIVLGFASLQALGRNSINNQILNHINTINLLQYENQSLETSYLYSLDNSYLEKIVSNLQTMEENAQAAVSIASGKQKTELEEILSNVTVCRENYQQISSLCQERGFTAEAGTYSQFLVNDSTLLQDFSAVANEKAWVDGSWISAVDNGNYTDADGSQFLKNTYNSSLPAVGKRDIFLPRLGGNNIIYSDTIYIANIVFSGSNGSVEVDIANMDIASVSAASYGDGYESTQLGSIDGVPALKLSTSFTGADGGWEEITLKIPVADYDIQNYSKVTYDVYFQNTHPEGIQIACALSDKYNFTDRLYTLNSLVTSYSKNVVEGSDVTAAITEINALIDEMIGKISDYVIDNTMKSNISSNMESKKNAFINISESDTSILTLKQENNTISLALTEQTTTVRNTIEEDTNASKATLTLTISVILIASAALIIVITLAISRGMNISIRKFEDTLKKVMDGDLNVRADDKGRDEFSIFGRTLNSFLEKLTEIIQSAQQISGNLSVSGDELKAMSVTSSETSSQIESAVTDISEGAASQAADIDNASGSISEMGSIFQKIVDNVDDLNNVTKEMRTIAQESTIFMKELAASNEKTAKAFEQVSQQIHITNESVNKIHEAAGFITSIASQTNLLSLNASIEAARAGEAGKGFAVVATEIQQLSEQSNASATNIENIIKELSVEANRTVEIIDEVTGVINEQQNKLLTTEKKFADLEEHVQMVGHENDEIKCYTTDCDIARQKVEEIIMNLSAISEENAASTNATTTSMVHLNETIRHLAEEAVTLNDFAEKLDSDLKFFQL